LADVHAVLSESLEGNKCKFKVSLSEKDVNINYLFGYYMIVITVEFSIDRGTLLSR
jgi:hypothetical protein